MNREQLIQKIAAAKEELKTAGKIHSRDLRKHIHRMEKELRDYDYFQRVSASRKSEGIA